MYLLFVFHITYTNTIHGNELSLLSSQLFYADSDLRLNKTKTNTTNCLYEQMVNKAKHEDHLVKQIQIYA